MRAVTVDTRVHVPDLDQRVEPERDQGERTGGDTETDRDEHLDAVPGDRPPLQTTAETLEPDLIVLSSSQGCSSE